MIDPQVRAAMLGKKIVDIEEHGSLILFRFHDGGEFIILSDWDEDPDTLDPVPRTPVVDFNLYGRKKAENPSS